MIKQGFYKGQIRHKRYQPKIHQFSYKMYWSLLDLDKLQQTFKQNKLWSIEHWNLVSFFRKDFHYLENLTNKQSIIETIKKRTGYDFIGKVYLLSHLRYLGYNFNSVTFYFCIGERGLEFIISEITNTPWGERYPYILDCREINGENYQFDFKKVFHISPFINMDMDYQWGFFFYNEELRIHMVVRNPEQGKIFDATFTGHFLPLNSSNMTKIAIRHPLQPIKMIFGIYWQAMKIWLKRIPVFDHPGRSDKHCCNK